MKSDFHLSLFLTLAPSLTLTLALSPTHVRFKVRLAAVASFRRAAEAEKEKFDAARKAREASDTSLIGLVLAR